MLSPLSLFAAPANSEHLAKAARNQIGVTIGAQPTVIHDIGRGAEESLLSALHAHRAIAPDRWPS